MRKAVTREVCEGGRIKNGEAVVLSKRRPWGQSVSVAQRPAPSAQP